MNFLHLCVLEPLREMTENDKKAEPLTVFIRNSGFSAKSKDSN